MGVSDNVLCITEIISLFPSVVPSHTVLGFADVKEGRSKRKMMRNRNKTGNKYRIKESKKKKKAVPSIKVKKSRIFFCSENVTTKN